MKRKKRSLLINVISFLILFILLCSVSGYAAGESAYQELCRQNKLSSADLIAWLEIPGASICEPVMRHPEDDAYYAKHAADGTTNTAGAVYVQQKYNADNFSDPVTLIYGSSALETDPFGKLQELFSGSFDQCRTVYVHLPEETREYTVFAALPYSSIHILHYYDFGVARRFGSFFDSIYSTRALGMHLDRENRPEYGQDQALILSTGLRGDALQRYLVMAKRVLIDR